MCSEASQQLDAIKDAFKQIYGYLYRIRNTLKTILEIEPRRSTTVPLPADGNARLTYTASCKNLESNVASGLPVSFTILYQDLPRVTFSVGALLSTVAKRDIVPVPQISERTNPKLVRVPTIDEGTSIPQAVPFSFLHARVYQWSCRRRDCAVNVTGGLGVNPNSGSNQAEFAVGTSWSIGRLNIFGGLHAARPRRLEGSFENALPPDRIISSEIAIPIERYWDFGVGFGFSFRIF
jgi:hypothetical protein